MAVQSRKGWTESGLQGSGNFPLFAGPARRSDRALPSLRTILVFLSLCLSAPGGPSPRVPAGLNAGYALEIRESARISARYTVTVDAPGVKASEWTLFIPRPPDLPSQRILHADTLPAGEVIIDQSPLRRPLLRTTIPVTRAGQASMVRMAADTRARLFSRTLVRRAPQAPVADLSEAERTAFLADTPQFNRSAVTLRRWIDESALHRRDREGEVDFARRVFLHIVTGFTYEYLGDQDRSAPFVCKAGKSDCGGLAVLFATVLRSQGIPSRTLAGRWAKSADPAEKLGNVAYRQEHIIAEFFAQGVGWVPVDLSSSILHDRSERKLEYFGKDPGLFLTLHLDADVMIDTRRFGVRRMPLLQRASYWAWGTGSVDGAVMQETWKVSLDPTPGK